MRSLLGLCALLLATATSALSTSGPRLLVLLDSISDKEHYSTFLSDLSSRGFDVSYETPRSEGLALFDLGERRYDHVLFMPMKVKALGVSLAAGKLVDFTNGGGNVLIAQNADLSTSTSLVGFLGEIGVGLPIERTGLVVDHFNYDAISAGEKHDTLVLDAPSPLRDDHKDIFNFPSNAVLVMPRTVGHTLGPSHLLTPILRAPSTAYSYNPKEESDMEDVFAAGKQLALVSAFQARNAARVVVLGSAEMISDAWIEASVSRVGGKKVVAANRQFGKVLSGWAFQELGVLKVNGVEHALKGSEELNPSIYRIKNEVSYNISLSEYIWDHWTPYTHPTSDALQLEFTMLSPFHRLNLTPISSTSTSTTYGTSFVLPDQHGIFSFRVNYKRPLLTSVDEKRQVSVRHFAHDEWPRSYVISGAWPWLSGIGATVVGWLFFCAIWVYSQSVERKGVKKTQ